MLFRLTVPDWPRGFRIADAFLLFIDGNLRNIVSLQLRNKIPRNSIAQVRYITSLVSTTYYVLRQYLTRQE